MRLVLICATFGKGILHLYKQETSIRNMSVILFNDTKKIPSSALGFVII